MQTTLFPCTSISEPALELLSALFGPFVVYQPLGGAIPEIMKRGQSAGRIHIRIPVKERDTDLLNLSKSYRQWIQTHSSSTRDFLRFQAGAGSLQESSASAIRDEVRHRLRGDAENLVSDPLIAARLFLLFAQENDLQQTEIQEDIDRLEEMEIRLFGSLRGEPSGEKDFDHRRDAAKAPDTNLPAVRRKAWAQLLACDDNRTDSYVTLSKASFEEVLDDIPPACLVPGFDPEPMDVSIIPDSGSDLRERLDAIAESAAKNEGIPIRLDDFPSSPGGARESVPPKIRLTLRVVRDRAPLQTFLPEGGESPLRPGNRLDSNTLIWHAEFYSG